MVESEPELVGRDGDQGSHDTADVQEQYMSEEERALQDYCKSIEFPAAPPNEDQVPGCPLSHVTIL